MAGGIPANPDVRQHEVIYAQAQETAGYWQVALSRKKGVTRRSGRRNWTRTNDPHHVKVVL
jgi:hypothetical protein